MRSSRHIHQHSFLLPNKIIQHGHTADNQRRPISNLRERRPDFIDVGKRLRTHNMKTFLLVEELMSKGGE